MFKHAVILLSLFIICLNQSTSKDIQFDYENESYFAIIGLTGCGKTSLLNALSNEIVSDINIKGFYKAQEQDIQKVEFQYKLIYFMLLIHRE